MPSRITFYCLFIFLWLLPAVSLHAQENGDTITTGENKTNLHLLFQQAEKQRNNGHPDSSIQTLEKAVHIGKVLNDNNAIAESLIKIAFCNQDKGAYKKSKEILDLAYVYCLKIPKQTRPMTRLYQGYGATYTLLGENDSAIYFMYKALKEIDLADTAQRSILTHLYNNLGTAWMQKGQLSQARFYLKKAETITLLIKDTLELATIYCNLGTISLAEKDTINALRYLNAALPILKKQHNIMGLQFTYYTLGNAQQNPIQAIPFYEAALAVDSTNANTAALYQGIGSIYYRLGNYRKAAPYYLKSEQICEAQNLFKHRLSNFSSLSSIYEHTKQYQLAFLYQVLYSNLSDSLLNSANAKALNQLEVKFRVEEKNKELAKSKLQLYKQQQWILVIAAGGLLLLILLATIFYTNRQKQKLQKEQILNFEQQQKIQQLHAEMQGEQQERSRIARELHDGINVLLSSAKMNYAALGKEFKQLPESETYNEVMQLLQDMGQELRTVTYKLVPELLIQQSLPDAIETFCELIEKGRNLSIELQTYGSFTALHPEICFAIYRIVQELTHNVVKHAEATEVLIQLVYLENIIHLTIEDNGQGFDTAKRSYGLGLNSVRTRVGALQGQITINSVIGIGTSIEIEIIYPQSNTETNQ